MFPAVSHTSAGTPALALRCSLTRPHLILALGYIETDKLLNAFLILLLSGAAGWVLTWLSEGSLRLPHLLIHPGQTQPDGKEEEQRGGGAEFNKIIKGGE